MMASSNVEMFAAGSWRDAKAGDAAAAVGCALPLLASGTAGQQLDVAMSAVLACAAKGDPTSRGVLAYAVRHAPPAARQRGPASTARRQPRRNARNAESWP